MLDVNTYASFFCPPPHSRCKYPQICTCILPLLTLIHADQSASSIWVSFEAENRSVSEIDSQFLWLPDTHQKEFCGDQEMVNNKEARRHHRRIKSRHVVNGGALDGWSGLGTWADWMDAWIWMDYALLFFLCISLRLSESMAIHGAVVAWFVNCLVGWFYMLQTQAWRWCSCLTFISRIYTTHIHVESSHILRLSGRFLRQDQSKYRGENQGVRQGSTV